MAKRKQAQRYVVVRTFSAGVHVGTLASRDGKEVTLTGARRIWSWRGANTLSEIALHGVGSGSRVSETVPEIVLTEAIEIIQCADEARANLEAATPAPPGSRPAAPLEPRPDWQS